jgi:hypothetical protein
LIYDYYGERYVTVALAESELTHLISRVPAPECTPAEVYTAANMAHLGGIGRYVAVVGCEGASEVSTRGSELFIAIARRDLEELAEGVRSEGASVLHLDGSQRGMSVTIVGERDGERLACVLPSRSSLGERGSRGTMGLGPATGWWVGFGHPGRSREVAPRR